uniref:Agenet domain-containing protein n=1 Tax=Leersia perrieri TaxID=77586 RepID=A0A0D9WCE5_9ORYZ
MRSPRLRRHPPPVAAAAPPADHFKPGDLVEVLPDHPAYRGAHFAATVTASHLNPSGYSVAYDAFVDGGESARPPPPLRDVVPASQVRPRPPDSAPGGGRVVAVWFAETREGAEFDAVDVRPHLEWVAGEWLSPEKMDISNTIPYTKGTKVEVAKLEAVEKVIWKNNVLVEYNCSNSDGSALPKEIVDLKHIRPCPPHASVVSFCINDEVEGFQGNGWWLGVIAEVHPEFKYTFKEAHSGKEVQLDQKALRLRYDWTDGQWQQVSQNVLTKFAKGSKVEVTSNDEGFRGAWFQGTALKYVDNKILVEYDMLKDDDEITPLTEAIEVQHVRPCPPDITVTNGFNLLDEVDACWNDGWWVGVISKVINDQTYMVYFRGSMEEMEFQHEQIRHHCDWVGGRWMRTSLYPSD